MRQALSSKEQADHKVTDGLSGYGVCWRIPQFLYICGIFTTETPLESVESPSDVSAQAEV